MRPLCVFDLDHTLVRSPLDLQAVKHEVRARVLAAGVPLPDEARTWTIGQIITRAGQHAPALAAACWAICEEHEERAVGAAQPEPGAHDTLAALRGADYPLAVWTNNSGAVARHALARCALHAFFATVVSRDEAALKPDPAGLEVLARAFPARRVVVVGDSWVDGAAAQAGGAAFVAYGTDPDELARRGVAARAVLHDLRALPAWLATADW